MARKDWDYSGDIKLESGGMFFKPLQDGMIEAVIVTPVSDAGGPDNKFLIESGSLHAGEEPDAWQESLDVCGYSVTHTPGADGGYWSIVDGMGAAHSVKTRHGMALLADAVRGCKGIDGPMREVVQIGADDPLWGDNRGGAWNPDPDTTLRGNAKIANYVAKHFL